jgi:nucleoid-associated protein YgaU
MVRDIRRPGSRNTWVALGLIAAVIFLAAIVAWQCGGDGDGDSSPTGSVTGSGSPTATPTRPAPTAAAAAPTPTPRPTTYTVQSGDTLSVLAEQWGTTVDAIVAANSLTDPDNLSVGQELKIP